MKHFKVQKEFTHTNDKSPYAYVIYKRKWFFFWVHFIKEIVFSDVENAMEFIYEYMGDTEEYEIDIEYGKY